jgi:hypothetical protein
MYMRRASRGLNLRVVADDLAHPGLRLDAVPDVLLGAETAARDWWQHDHPELGWVAIALLVTAADVTGTRTMSEAFRTASQSAVGRPLMIVGWTVLTAHLFGLIPPGRDPINMLWKRCHV